MFKYSREELMLAGRMLYILLWSFMFILNMFFVFFGTIKILSFIAAICAAIQVVWSVRALIKKLNKLDKR